jgi:ribose transport system substrate-binding protein
MILPTITRRVLFASTLLAIALAGCTNQNDTAPSANTATAGNTTTSTTPSGGKVLALIVKTMDNPFFVSMREGAEKAAAAEGVELRVLAPPRETDAEKQADMVADALAQGAHAILIAPSNSTAIVAPLLEANRKGVPIINVDNRIDAKAAESAGLKVEGYVGADNEAGGQMAGEHLAKLLGGKGKVALLEGIRGADNAEARKRGFLDGIKGSPAIELVAQNTANWMIAEAEQVFADMLQRHPDLDGVFAANDNMALGAIAALKAAGKAGKVKVVGFDNIKDAQQAMRDGTMHGTIEQHPDLMGAEAVRFASAVLDRRTPEKREVLVTLEVVTPETLAERGGAANSAATNSAARDSTGASKPAEKLDSSR